MQEQMQVRVRHLQPGRRLLSKNPQWNRQKDKTSKKHDSLVRLTYPFTISPRSQTFPRSGKLPKRGNEQQRTITWLTWDTNLRRSLLITSTAYIMTCLYCFIAGRMALPRNDSYSVLRLIAISSPLTTDHDSNILHRQWPVFLFSQNVLNTGCWTSEDPQ